MPIKCLRCFGGSVALIQSSNCSESRSRNIETCEGITYPNTIICCLQGIQHSAPWRNRWQRKLAQILPSLGTVLCSLLEITLWSSRKPDTLPERSSQICSQREVHGVALKKCRKGLIFSWESSHFCIMYYRWSKKCQGKSAPLRLR